MLIRISREEIVEMMAKKVPSNIPVEMGEISENLMTIKISKSLLNFTLSLSNPDLNKNGWLRFNVKPSNLTLLMDLVAKFKPDMKEKIRSKNGRIAIKLPDEVLNKFEIEEIKFIDNNIEVIGKAII